jgi:hypothetical protein
MCRLPVAARVIGVAGLFALTPAVESADLPAQTLIPTRYAGDRFFAKVITIRGDSLLLFIDSGGGGYWVTKHALDRMGMKGNFEAIEDGDSIFSGERIPTFRPNASIPFPLGVPDSTMFAVRTSEMLRQMENADGQLGHKWFAGRVWVSDYPKHQLSYFETSPPARPFDLHTIPMTLKNPMAQNFPRIQVNVAGDTVDMLLDTGATSEFSPAAIAVMGDGPPIRASAFVATRLWDRWRKAHPDWRILSGAEVPSRADVIEVPTVNIAGYDVGPIWFAKRPNRAYDGMMSPLMDKPILASIGGQAFKSFRITMDYPNQRVTFEKP